MVPYDVSNSLPRFVKHFWDSKSFRQCNVLFTFFPVQRSDFLLSNATFVNPCSSLHLLLSHIYFKQLSSSFINKRIGTIKWTTATFNDTPCPPLLCPAHSMLWHCFQFCKQQTKSRKTYKSKENWYTISHLKYRDLILCESPCHASDVMWQKRQKNLFVDLFEWKLFHTPFREQNLRDK